MKILLAILTALCVLVLSRWLLGQRPGATQHVQLLPDGSVPDMDRPAPGARAEPVSEPVPVADDAAASKGTGTDAADVVRSGSSVAPDSEADEPADDQGAEVADDGTPEAEEADAADDAGVPAADGQPDAAATDDQPDEAVTDDQPDETVTDQQPDEAASDDAATEEGPEDTTDDATTAESTEGEGEDERTP